MQKALFHASSAHISARAAFLQSVDEWRQDSCQDFLTRVRTSDRLTRRTCRHTSTALDVSTVRTFYDTLETTCGHPVLSSVLRLARDDWDEAVAFMEAPAPCSDCDNEDCPSNTSRRCPPFAFCPINRAWTCVAFAGDVLRLRQRGLPQQHLPQGRSLNDSALTLMSPPPCVP